MKPVVRSDRDNTARFENPAGCCNGISSDGEDNAG